MRWGGCKLAHRSGHRERRCLQEGAWRRLLRMAKERKIKGKEVVTREYTINLHKRLHGVTFKKRAPQAIKHVKKFAQKMMKTKDVRVDVKLNKVIWSKGIKNVPTRLRVRIARKRSDEDDADEALYSYVTAAEDQTTKGKTNVTVDED